MTFGAVTGATNAALAVELPILTVSACACSARAGGPPHLHGAAQFAGRVRHRPPARAVCRALLSAAGSLPAWRWLLVLPLGWLRAPSA